MTILYACAIVQQNWFLESKIEKNHRELKKKVFLEKKKKPE